MSDSKYVSPDKNNDSANSSASSSLNNASAVSQADAFLDDYFADLLSVDVKPPQKKLNVSTRSKSKPVSSKTVIPKDAGSRETGLREVGQRGVAQRETEPKITESKNSECKTTTANKTKPKAVTQSTSKIKTPCVKQGLTQEKAIGLQNVHVNDVKTQIKNAPLIKEPLTKEPVRKEAVSTPLAQQLKSTSAEPKDNPLLSHNIEHASTQKKALQQLLNRSIEAASEHQTEKQLAQKKALLENTNPSKKPETNAHQKKLLQNTELTHAAFSTEPKHKLKPNIKLNTMPEVELKVEVEVKRQVKPETQKQPDSIAASKIEVASSLSAKNLSNNKEPSLQPKWGQADFEVLLFSVAGLTLAVPLVSLGQIYPLNNDITPIFGKSKWYMGIKTTPTGKVHVVNTAMFVMPEKYQETHAQSVKYVVTIDGYPWGLAVDKIDQPQTITQAQVKWRTERSKRAWLAGTIKSAMCGLIDVQKMGEMLMNDEKD